MSSSSASRSRAGCPPTWPISLAGTIGYTIGSIGGWAIGLYGGRPFVERRGRWLHLDAERLAKADRWFERHGDWAVFLGRITPVVRSFVAIPAGIARMPLGRYTLLTLLGSAIWCFAFAGIGWALARTGSASTTPSATPTTRSPPSSSWQPPTWAGAGGPAAGARAPCAPSSTPTRAELHGAGRCGRCRSVGDSPARGQAPTRGQWR